MKRYLLDTNHLSAAIKPVSQVRERLHLARRRGLRVGTCVPVLCELEAGIQNLRSYSERQRTLENVPQFVNIWPLDYEVAAPFVELFRQATAAGRVLSQVDLMRAAMARLSKLTLLTTDKDFAVFPDVTVENWVA